MAKEANAALDAVDSRILERELPGIRSAFDPTAMRSHLDEALIGRPGRSRTRSRIRRGHLASAILMTDRDCAVMRYDVQVEDQTGRVRPALVTARFYPDAELAAAYEATRLSPLVAQVRGRDEIAPFPHPVAVIEPLATVVHAFPIDGELPTLVPATDPAVAGRAIQDLLVAAGRADAKIENCRADPVHYSRRHRCMLRYRLDLAGGQRLVVYGKVEGDGSGRRIPPIVEALRATIARAGVAVPECLGFREDLQLVVFTEIPGAPRVAQLLDARLRGEAPAPGLTVEDGVETCGRIAAALHTSGLRLGAPRPLSAEVARLHGNLSPMQRLAPELARRLGSFLDRAEAAAAATPAADPCQCHGDFSYTQLIFEGPDAGLVDFDNFCQAEPALDLGQFLAYLHYAGVRARGSSAAVRARVVEELAQRFASAYVDAGGPAETLDRVSAYEVVNLVRMAQHAWQNLKPRRLNDILTVLGERLPTED